MRTYLVCYDLAAASARKATVANAIMTLGESWARPLDNVWYIRTATGVDEIEARLGTAVDVEDGLVIQAVREDAVMLNTGLRWFRQRRAAPANGTMAVAGGVGSDNVVVFPGPVANDAVALQATG